MHTVDRGRTGVVKANHSRHVVALGVILLSGLAMLVLASTAVAAEEIDPFEQAKGLSDKVQYASDHHIHIPSWLLVMVGLTVVGLCISGLRQAFKKSG